MGTYTVIHHIFEECKNYTLDSYWKSIFSDCARNKFPDGIARYDASKNVLYLKKAGAGRKKIYEVVSIPKGDSVDIFKAMMKIFREMLGMMSAKDSQVSNVEMDSTGKKHGKVMIDCEWKKIRPRYLKDQLLLRYASELQVKHGLSAAEVKNLNSVISIGFKFKQFSSDDVEYADGKIYDIRGLIFDEKKRIFYAEHTPDVSGKTEKSSSANHFLQHYDKYLKDYSSRQR